MRKPEIRRPDENLMPGFKPVMELLLQEPERINKIYLARDMRRAEKISALCYRNGIPLEKVDAAFLDAACLGGDGRKTAHQGVIAAISAASLTGLEDLLANLPLAPLPVALALDQARDPGNVGAICRTAYALGCAGMILPRHNSASLGPAAFRASAGALGKLPCAVATNLAHALDMAEEMGFSIYGASSESAYGKKADSDHVYVNALTCEWNFPMILVMGSENKGIRPGVAKRCAYRLNIPLARKFDSLNVAQAAAIILGLCAAKAHAS